MAAFNFNNPHFTVNTDDLSDYIQSISMPLTTDALDETASGDDSRKYVPGLKDGTITVTFKQDFAASAVDDSLWDIYDGNASVAFAVRPKQDAVGGTNPEYSGNCVLTEYTPLGNSIGELATATVTFQIDGDVARATS